MAIQILLMFCENLGESVLRNVVQVCLFVRAMLDTDSEDEETISLALGVLDIIIGSAYFLL